ncbi:MAG: hypothetical protein LBQ60_06475 [Bacteroidales bacterium]|jgi:hypothetical protein|nr:hypothetical protein [Bacteroidales bacterium]
MKFKVYFLVSLFTITAITCNKEEEPEISNNYITDYIYEPDYLSLTFIYPGGGGIKADMSYVSIKDASLLLIVEGKKTNQNEADFNVFSEIMKDQTFNQSVEKTFPVSCLADSISDISIFTNQNYNDTYPEGSIINDIVDISYLLPKKVIDSGYNQSISLLEEQSLYSFNQNIRAFTSITFEFRFTSPPSRNGVYSFTLQYTSKDGTILEKTIDGVHLSNL